MEAEQILLVTVDQIRALIYCELILMPVIISSTVGRNFSLT